VFWPVWMTYSIFGGWLGHWKGDEKRSKRNNCAEWAYWENTMKGIWASCTNVHIIQIWGAVPQSFCMRNWLITGTVFGLVCSVMYPCLTTRGWARNHHTGNQDTEVHQEGTWILGATLFSILYGWGWWTLNMYSVRSAYGVYCCASFPKGRVSRNWYLVMLGVYYDYYGGIFLATWNDPMKAFFIFAWKRVRYIQMLLVLLDDNPWKMWAMLPNSYTGLLWLNSAVAMAMTGAKDPIDMMSFLVIDNFQFGMRFVLIARLGFKHCPRLFSFVLSKQLQNICSPLPQHVNAFGHKTAMRVMQAMMVIFEGETLTSNLLWIAVYFLHWGTILRHELAFANIPQKTWAMIGVFCAVDFAQDMLAGHIAEKFSNWGYMYSNKKWFSRTYFFQRFFIYFGWSGYMINWGTGPIRAPLFKLHKSVDSFLMTRYAGSENTSLLV